MDTEHLLAVVGELSRLPNCPIPDRPGILRRQAMLLERMALEADRHAEVHRGLDLFD